MGSSKSKDIEMVLEMVRQLVAAVKDDSLDDEDADQLVGKLLVGLDQMMAKIDGDDPSMAPPHLINKLEIEPPKTKTKTKRTKSK
jgi:hypothetical protein